MKWLTLVGRLGTVIFMTGLALGLISLIPSVQMAPSSSGGMTFLQPENYDFLYVYGQLTPQSGVKISIESNSSVDIYLLNIHMRDFENWTMTWVVQRFANLTELELWSWSRKTIVLNAFLVSHPDRVLWESESATTTTKEFYPSADSNATGIIANPSLNLVQCSYETVQVTSLAPKARVVLLAEALIPLGFVLAIPWTYSTRMRKPQLN